jgi:hypothetical protein
MQLLRQISLLSSFGDERVYCIYFSDRARFETARIVENELRITLEYQLVFDIMLSSLW